jgi:hypothetical protein
MKYRFYNICIPQTYTKFNEFKFLSFTFNFQIGLDRNHLMNDKPQTSKVRLKIKCIIFWGNYIECIITLKLVLPKMGPS